jgi:hypothetical protein
MLKLGKTPGRDVLYKETGIKPSEISYYWPRPSALAEEAGAEPNQLQPRLTDEAVFQDYAKICLRIGAIPTVNELRIQQRELKTKTHTVYSRHGTIQQFQANFRAWLETSDENLKCILTFQGWAATKTQDSQSQEKPASAQPQFHPFLPGCLQYLDAIALGERPPFESPNTNINTLFERRTAEAFTCLGFEVRQLGQGTGRNADSLACAPRERIALIIDAKVRSNGYVLGTEDRKFLDYAVKHGPELQKQGFEKIYLAVVGPSFREPDLKQLENYLHDSPIRGITLITARALMRIVEGSIRERSKFSLSELNKKFFGNKIISE